MNCRLLVRVLVVGLCTEAFSFGAGDQSGVRPKTVIPLDAEIQEEINRTVTALSAGEMPEDAAQEIVKKFMGFKNKSPQELLLQVLAVYGGKDEHRSNPHAEMAKRLLLFHLLQDMASSNIVATVAPKYEQASTPKLEYSLRQALAMAIFKGGRVDPDFEALSAYIAQNKEQPPRKLVEFMYSHNPQAAVLSMSRVYGDKATEAELAAQLKGDPKATIQSLVDWPEWWAHLYVAEMMKKNPQLRDPEIIKKLEIDEHPLVRETVEGLKPKQKESPPAE